MCQVGERKKDFSYFTFQDLIEQQNLHRERELRESDGERYQGIKVAYGERDADPSLRLGPCQVTEVLQGINGSTSKSTQKGVECNDVDNLGLALEQIPEDRVRLQLRQNHFQFVLLDFNAKTRNE